ncbi:MAG: hypothetical protein QNJ72_39960 [Pleurocapsa sp. MO_226.B13]|nr:hypothetical protein [Pleurocapsa sp. MO_226.B13]
MNERMKGMKLGNFSGIKKPKTESTKPPEPKVTEPEVEPTETKPVKTSDSKAKVGKKPKAQKKEQVVTVNIKIRKNQKEWLANTASTVRDNNTEPVPPAERVYPQHLIGVAIDLLQNVDVDWAEVKNVEQLREYLNL